MHAFILILWAFFAPTPANPHVTVRATIAIAPTTVEDCKALGEASASQVAQLKGVTDVKFDCIEITDGATQPT